MVEESEKMIVNTRERLNKTVEDLQRFIVGGPSNARNTVITLAFSLQTSSKAEFADLEGDEDLSAAEATLKSVTA